MRQLLLRVPDDLHHRLTARAADGHRSVNAVATEILDAALGADDEDRRARLRARATGLGILRSTDSKKLSNARRQRVLASTKGIGPVLDRLIDEDRSRS